MKTYLIDWVFGKIISINYEEEEQKPKSQEAQL